MKQYNLGDLHLWGSLNSLNIIVFQQKISADIILTSLCQNRYDQSGW